MARPAIYTSDIEIKIMAEGEIHYKFVEEFHNGSRHKTTENIICQEEISLRRTVAKISTKFWVELSPHKTVIR